MRTIALVGAKSEVEVWRFWLVHTWAIHMPFLEALTRQASLASVFCLHTYNRLPFSIARVLVACSSLCMWPAKWKFKSSPEHASNKNAPPIITGSQWQGSPRTVYSTSRIR